MPLIDRPNMPELPVLRPEPELLPQNMRLKSMVIDVFYSRKTPDDFETTNTDVSYNTPKDGCACSVSGDRVSKSNLINEINSCSHASEMYEVVKKHASKDTTYFDEKIMNALQDSVRLAAMYGEESGKDSFLRKLNEYLAGRE